MLAKRKSKLAYENLEARKLLATTAGVMDGDLYLSGEADGEIEIVAVTESTFRVSDNGVTIADESTLDNVTDDIRINLRTDSSDNTVSLNLEGTELDMVYANLGDGDNFLELTGGEASKIIFRGGVDNDTIEINSAVESAAYFRLGDGDDSVQLNGEISRVGIIGGDGNDSVSLEGESTLDRVYMNLGEGDNLATLNGEVDGNVRIRTNQGDNEISFSDTSIVTGQVRITTDDGSNLIFVNGTIEGELRLHASDGDDSLEFAETAFADSIHAKLGDGENYVLIEGTVENEVNIVSLNEDDIFEVKDTASIDGESQLLPGEQSDEGTRDRHPRFRRPGFGHHRFSGRGFGFHRGSRFGGFGGWHRPYTPDTPSTDTPDETDETDHDHDNEDDHDHSNTSQGWDGSGQGSAELTYYIDASGIPSNLTISVVTEAIETALSAWSEVADITFTQTSTAGLDDSLDFSFTSIDGNGGTVAQAYFPDDVNNSSIAGDVQFDISESWEVGNSQGNSAFDLVYVAAHEIGHSLGLEHTSDTGSVLYPSVSANQQFQGLSQTDVNEVLEIYASRTV